MPRASRSDGVRRTVALSSSRFDSSLPRMNRREQIKMSAAEVAAFLAEERTVTCATIGKDGWAHLMPLWYVLRGHSAGEPGPRIWSWTYAASQKVRNIERDSRATLQVEAGEE